MNTMWGVREANQGDSVLTSGGVAPGGSAGHKKPMKPRIILDDAVTGRLSIFSRALGTIRADTPGEVPQALAAIETARRAGRHVAGYFSYELGYALERRLAPLMPPDRAVPLMWFGVFDAPEVVEGAGIDVAFDAWCEGRAYGSPLVHDWDAQDYRQRFDQVRDLIAAGDLYQANLSFRSRFAFLGDPLAFYRGLRAASAARHGAYIDDGERHILSLSPELFFELSPDGAITRPPDEGHGGARRAMPQRDDGRAHTLAASAKDRAENLMIVDLLRNDLGRIARNRQRRSRAISSRSKPIPPCIRWSPA